MEKIETTINECIDYIENCKNVAFSSGKVSVDKEEMLELLKTLKKQFPEELKIARKIVSRREEILADANSKAEAILADAAQRTSQMLSENQIMQQAYEQADGVIYSAYQEAQTVVNNATLEANQLKEAAFAYVDGVMAETERLLASTIESNNARYQEMQSSLNQYYQIVKTNRSELRPTPAAPAAGSIVEGMDVEAAPAPAAAPAVDEEFEY